MSPRGDRFRSRVKCLDDPARLVRRWLECADAEQLLRDLIDRDETGPAAERLRQVLAERQEAYLQGASWLAQLQASRGTAADEEVLWQLVERWAMRGDLEHLGEQGPVWRAMSGDLAVALMVRGGATRRGAHGCTGDTAGTEADGDRRLGGENAEGQSLNDKDAGSEPGSDERETDEPEWGA